MDLKCYLNGKEYKDKIVQGIVISEEYNETLDSASVIISQVPKIKDLRPYDDFFIYENEFKGYGKNNDNIVSTPVEKNPVNIDLYCHDKEDKQIDITLSSEHLKSFYLFTTTLEFFDYDGNSILTKDYELVTEKKDEKDVIILKPLDKHEGDILPEIEFTYEPFSWMGNIEENENIIYASWVQEEEIKDGLTSNDSYVYYIRFSNCIIVEKDENGLEKDSLFGVSQSVNEMLLTEKEKTFKRPSKYFSEFRLSIDFEENYYDSEITFKFRQINYEKTDEEIWLINDEYDVDVVYNFTIENDSTVKLTTQDFRFPVLTAVKQGAYAVLSFEIENDQDFTYIDYYETFNLKNVEKFILYYKGDSIVYDEFYRHFLVDQYVEEMLNLNDDPEKILYKYKIELFSETKRLETIQIPNFSVTQPQNGTTKRDIYSYICDVVEMYSPLIKIGGTDENNAIWRYKKKYTVDESLKEKFEKLYCPDFSLNNPNLRDVLSQLMLVADMIPYVEDDVIKAMDITERKGKFDNSVGEITRIYGSRTSSNHCDSLKRTYSNALSQENTAHTVEQIGFRNSDSAMLTIENLRLETRFPIYKINKMYMSYYKKIFIRPKKVWMSGYSYKVGDVVRLNEDVNFPAYVCKIENSDETFDYDKWSIDDKEQYKVFLCKQDITPLVLLNSLRNLISQDWTEVKNDGDIDSVEKMSKYKFFTLGYDIGSNQINGFGTMYEYFENPFWNKQATYIQNILFNLDKLYPYGCNDYDYFYNLMGDNSQYEFVEYSGAPIAKDYGKWMKKYVVSPFEKSNLSLFGDFTPLFLKSLFFEINYIAFYNGTIYHSKDTDRDDITINDNSSSSLTLLEQDGIHQKEKANRFGNKTIQINARYKNINEVQKLGSVFEYADETDVIIYHKQYSIFDNIINCTYSGSHDYVLKNYFTSVYAKHRPFNLLSYGESVRRSENRKMYVMLSKDKAYIENENKKIKFSGLKKDFVPKLLSFFMPSKYFSDSGDLKKEDKINAALFTFKNKKYIGDVNFFTSGNSLCFNASMYDNVSSGLYLDKNQLEPDMNWEESLGISDKTNAYVRGTLQRWYLNVDSTDNGFIREMGLYVGHLQQNNYKLFDDEEKALSYIKNGLFAYPKLEERYSNLSNVIGGNYILNKDNKELIDMTFQFEITKEHKDEKMFFSPWMMKLSDMYGAYDKFEENVTTNDLPKLKKVNEIFAFSGSVKKMVTYPPNITYEKYFAPVIIVSIWDDSEIDIENYFKNFRYDADIVNLGYDSVVKDRVIRKFSLIFQGCESIDKDEIVINAIREMTLATRNVVGGGEKLSNITDNVQLVLKKITSFGASKPESGQTWYSNCELKMRDGANPYYDTAYDIDFFEENKIEISSIDLDIAEIKCQSNVVLSNLSLSKIVKQNCIYQSFAEQKDEELIYSKNLFITTSKERIDKSIIYKQVPYSSNENYLDSDQNFEFDNTLYSYNLLQIQKDEQNSVYKLRVFLPSKYKKNKKESIQLWYLYNDTYHFVWGVNIDKDDFGSTGYGFINYYISLLSSRDLRVFNSSRKEIGTVKNVANSEEVETEQTYETNEE